MPTFVGDWYHDPFLSYAYQRNVSKSNRVNQVNLVCEESILNELEESGCVWIREILALDQCRIIGEQLDTALKNADSSLRSGEQIYGARNLLDVFPAAILR